MDCALYSCTMISSVCLSVFIFITFWLVFGDIIAIYRCEIASLKICRLKCAIFKRDTFFWTGGCMDGHDEICCSGLQKSVRLFR